MAATNPVPRTTTTSARDLIDTPTSVAESRSCMRRTGAGTATAASWLNSGTKATRSTTRQSDIAFKSIGQKYGFVSAGDVRRKMVADAEADAEAKAQEDKLNTARGLLQDGVSMEILTRRFNLSEEAILGK